jgi:hypothetical protein
MWNQDRFPSITVATTLSLSLLPRAADASPDGVDSKRRPGSGRARNQNTSRTHLQLVAEQRKLGENLRRRFQFFKFNTGVLPPTYVFLFRTLLTPQIHYLHFKLVFAFDFSRSVADFGTK